MPSDSDDRWVDLQHQRRTIHHFTSFVAGWGWVAALLYATTSIVRSFLACLIAILLVASGCSDGITGIESTREPQDAVVYLYPDFAFVAVVDQTGNELRLTDGMPLVMDNPTFERVVLPVTKGERRAGTFEKNYIRVDARFRIERDNLVVGVIQTPDGSVEEVGKDYWVLKIDTIRSAQWCPANP
ncbi:hypothetical protein [Novipirellula artificiosorum]|uniref:Uncharacterized protein n=1 Tax=Novipirellula artificiosorum TaxID=2528016 RepID=A0A5C6D9D3_9BACT|nr:hypothetical protein [Novipirellula artificiosorum]TWU33358.1 hypothetical protein Poly41_51120 [Novipirellula artificiosorum]